MSFLQFIHDAIINTLENTYFTKIYRFNYVDNRIFLFSNNEGNLRNKTTYKNKIIINNTIS